MKLLLFAMALLSLSSPLVLFDFNTSTDLSSWLIVDDVVMGGRSSGTFNIDNEGNGVFQGTVSIENNGGFSSMRHRSEGNVCKGAEKVCIRLKGDGKDYQFRVKSNANDYFSYIMPFSTNGEWQEVQLPLKKMYPSFRGRKLDQPNFHEDYIEEITFLIANKKSENFKLVIDKIELK